MLMLSVPMVVFYEVAILIGSFIAKRQAAQGRVTPPPPGPARRPAASGGTTYPFELDDFQRRADRRPSTTGASVLVAAPTGSGKTVVAEHAVARALAEGGKAFYTTPIKALSNQKFADLARRHGARQRRAC